ncbi:hypothetical protein VTJ83DRAFT_7485 [Remersonia thermophila]|uniref:rRNA methyltransferase 2, mitochondrial n=1 Tax=Remersonia thermophila TaxID=72144 RepID=A0ABR4D4M6_9PEZI
MLAARKRTATTMVAVSRSHHAPPASHSWSTILQPRLATTSSSNARPFSTLLSSPPSIFAIKRIHPTTPPTHLLPSPSASPVTRRIPFRPSSSSSRWKLRQVNDAYAREAKVQGLKSRAAFKLFELDAKYHLFRRGRGQVVVDLGFAPGSWSQVAADRTGPDGVVVGIDIIPAQPPKGVSAIQGNFLSPGVQEMVKKFLVDVDTRRRREREEKRRLRLEQGLEAAAEEEEDGYVVEDRPSYIDLERWAAAESVEAAPEADENAAASSSAVAAAAAEKGEEKGRSGQQHQHEHNLRLVDVVLSDMSAPWPQTHGFSVNTLSNPYIRMMNTSGITFKDHAGSMDLCYAALSFASDTLKPGGNFVCKFYQGKEDKELETLLKKMFARVHREKPGSSRSESREAFFVALRRKGDVTLQDIEGHNH